MAEHDTLATGQHRQPGWYWVRWTPNGFWFPVQWFRGHDGQEFWVGGRAGQPAAEVGSRIREMGEDQREGYTMRDDTLADRDNLAARFIPRATKRAIVKEAMHTLAGKAAADAHGGPARKTQAEDEIEITPEMIEAGLSGLWQFHPDRQDEREAVCWIFLKMLRARR